MGAITVNGIKIDNPQIGGWYEGRQLWTDPSGNWTLSEPGQINTYSNQPGAGGLVSEEVIAQTNPNNVAYIQEERAKLGLTPSPATGVPSFTSPSGQTSLTPTFSGLGTTGDFSFTPPSQTINLPDIYKNLYATSGISDSEAELVNLQKQYLEAKSKISDNPFLSASMVDQRLQRLENKYNEKINPLKNEIAMKKADIETQLNLQTKQFDINSQSARDALNYFNTLLEAGALDTASGEALAQFTYSTGIPSSLIQSAINARNEAKKKDVKTQVITSTADDGTVTATVINTQTGDVISQQNLGKVGNAQTGDTKVSESEAKQLVISDLQQRAGKGETWDDLYRSAIGIIDPLLIYQIYLSANYYKPTEKQKAEDLKRYGIKSDMVGY